MEVKLQVLNNTYFWLIFKLKQMIILKTDNTQTQNNKSVSENRLQWWSAAVEEELKSVPE